MSNANEDLYDAVMKAILVLALVGLCLFGVGVAVGRFVLR